MEKWAARTQERVPNRRKSAHPRAQSLGLLNAGTHLNPLLETTLVKLNVPTMSALLICTLDMGQEEKARFIEKKMRTTLLKQLKHNLLSDGAKQRSQNTPVCVRMHPHSWPRELRAGRSSFTRKCLISVCGPHEKNR